MGSTLTIPAASALAPRTVIADPGENPGESKVRPGGILVWSNRSTTSSHFALEFTNNGGRGPASPEDTLFGTGSIVLRVGKDTLGTFPYTIQYSSGPGSPVDSVSTTFSVHSCVTC
jgi:hypothetical protein